jgi:hypothetical protein
MSSSNRSFAQRFTSNTRPFRSMTSAGSPHYQNWQAPSLPRSATDDWRATDTALTAPQKRGSPVAGSCRQAGLAARTARACSVIQLAWWCLPCICCAWRFEVDIFALPDGFVACLAPGKSDRCGAPARPPCCFGAGKGWGGGWMGWYVPDCARAAEPSATVARVARISLRISFLPLHLVYRLTPTHRPPKQLANPESPL